MIKLLTEQFSGKLGKGLGLGSKEATRFNKLAQQSDIGGSSVPFRRMNLDQQNEFIQQYNEAQVGKGTSTSETLTRQQRVSRSRDIDPRHNKRPRNVAIDDGRVSQPNTQIPDPLNTLPPAPEKLTQQQRIDKQGGTIEGYYDPPTRAPSRATGRSHQLTGSANPRSATPIDVDQSRPAKPIVERAVETAPGEPGLMQRTLNRLTEDTSGRAAAEAGQSFEQSYKNVFSSDATAEAFGVEQNVLKDAFGKSGEEFAEVLKRGGLDEEGVKGLEAFRGEVKRVGDEGGQLSEEGMQSMLKNQGEIGNMYGGFSRAGATASPNALLRGMGGEGTGMESVMGIAAVAGLAGGANVAMGGDFTEGAAVGGIGALSVRGIAKGVAGSMGDIENAMMKNILGDDMATKTVAAKPAVMQGEALSRIPASRLQDDTLGELTGNPLIPNAKVKLSDATPDQKSGLAYMGQELEREAAINARRQNLTAIQKMGDDDERLQGFGKKKMRDMLNPNKEKNVAMNNRALVLGGGMLSGVAFTGNADRRDYRRGFNAHRGNRI